MHNFADIILPISVQGSFTYKIPEDLFSFIKIGCRVVVQFGKNKIYSGIVINIHNQEPENYQTKDILSIIDQKPIINNIQLKFWQWISDYYLCSIGEVMKAALPSALKLASETKISINPNYSGEISELTPKELLIVDALINVPSLSIQDIIKIVGQQKVIHIIKNLIDKNILIIEEEIHDNYKPKIETEIVLNSPYNSSEKELSSLLDNLNSKKTTYKQMLFLMGFLKLTEGKMDKSVYKSNLLKLPECSTNILNTLIKKHIILTKELIISRLKKFDSKKNVSEIIYSDLQKQTIQDIDNQFKENSVVLLEGITGSGKTEIYINFIDKAIKLGKQVLYLLPEIALTTQIINRLNEYFGDKIGVYHSRFNEYEKVEIWNSVINESQFKLNNYSIIIGARSSLFLPFSNLGLIIIDEEHDTSYKQYDPSPRYNARSAGLYLAKLHNATTILGSATPSIESYYLAQNKKYSLIQLNERYSGIKLPEIVIVDIKEQTKQKKMKSVFSTILLEKIRETIENKEQVILFQNRRGFSPRIECSECNYIPKCIRCDVSLTYHKKNEIMKCHYCGFTIAPPKQCPVCKSTNLQTKGLGTEKIEEELSIFFPELSIKRMDYDTTRSKNSYQEIITQFENQKISILVGTQMVTKGLDFENVGLVGVLNADNLINFPDFRSYERAYQMLVQVSGRAGRKNKQGSVIIQTYSPQNDIFKLIIENNFFEFYENQRKDRKKFLYPPYIRLVSLSVKHKNSSVLNKASSILANMLKQKFNKYVLGPEYPIVGMINNWYIKNIIIKLEINKDYNQNKTEIINIIKQFKTIQEFKGAIISIDVDPQ